MLFALPVRARHLMSTGPRLALLGLPWDRSSSFERGAAAAPPEIRRALWSPSTNTSTELGVAIEPATLDDRGDVALFGGAADARTAIERGVAAILAEGAVPLLLGGDHSVTYPALRAFRGRPPAAILHIDAHGDLYDEFPLPGPGDPAGLGDRYSHACPFARVMEEGLTGRLVQVGIRTMTPHLRAQAAALRCRGLRHGALGRGAGRGAARPALRLARPRRPGPGLRAWRGPSRTGGLSTRDVVGLLHRIRAPIAGGDVVELSPRRDIRDLTAGSPPSC